MDDGQRPRDEHTELVELVLNDPGVRAAMDSDAWVQASRQTYDRYAAGALSELREAGFDLPDSIADLRNISGHYKAAIPILLQWLPRVQYISVAIDIVDTLGVSYARDQAVPVLVDLFKDPPAFIDPMNTGAAPVPTDAFREAVSDCLGRFAGPAIADHLIPLAINTAFGSSRGLLVASLYKLKSARAESALIDLLDDASVSSFAAEALGKMKSRSAEARLSALLSSVDPKLRASTIKALKRIRAS